MKYALIHQQADKHHVAVWCRVLGVSRSGYYHWLKQYPTQRQQRDQQLLTEIRRVHLETRERYGAVKTWKVLQARGIPCGKHRVARLRREQGVVAKRRRRHQAATYARRAERPALPNLVNRRFQAAGPNRLWVGDTTFINTREGWLYVAVLMDMWSRRIVGWSMSERHDVPLVLAALQMGLAGRAPAAGLVHHTDRGAIYGSAEYQAVLLRHGIQPSMSRKGNCYDNAAAESFFSTLKNELVHGIRFANRDHARREIVPFIEGFYNRTRIHQAIHYVSPATFEKQLEGVGLIRPTKAG